MTEENKYRNIHEELDRAATALASADTLIQNGYYNDAVSRLYYSLFHAVKALLLSEGLEPKTHEGTLTLFSKYFIKTNVFTPQDSHIFSRLMKYREEADYNPSYIFTRKDCDEWRYDVDKLSNMIKSYLKDKKYIE
ncbi:MAG: HEPN domain-containing protein [Ignavibacteriales bacterium]|nr:HEPN domain-containing protein [Ignavibacteriales bacterium]